MCHNFEAEPLLRWSLLMLKNYANYVDRADILKQKQYNQLMKYFIKAVTKFHLETGKLLMAMGYIYTALSLYFIANFEQIIIITKT